MPPIIQPESPQDAPGIRALLLAAFPGPLEAQLVEDLRAARRLTHSLIALSGDTIIGHIALSPVTVAGTGKGLGLAPLAVLPTHQKQGVGGALVNQAIAHAKSSGHAFIVLLGDPAYYARFGFTRASRHGLIDEYEGGNAFQVLELTPAGIPQNAGTVKYAPEFAIFTP